MFLLPHLSDEVQLGIGVKQFLKLLAELHGIDCSVIEILEPLFQQLKHGRTVEAFDGRNLMHLVVFQATDDSHRHIERVAFLHVTALSKVNWDLVCLFLVIVLIAFKN